MASRARLWCAALLAGAALPGCVAEDPPGCLARGGARCLPPSPCARLDYACEGGFARAFRLASPAERPPGLAALASVGDYVLANDRLVAVIDAPDHPHHVGLTGGRLIDLAPRGGADHLHYVCAATGVLPGDMARFHTAEIVADAGAAVVVVRGALGADPRVEMVVRYELRPCDPGVRVRSEVYNGGRTVWPLFLADFVLWGTRGLTPFVPLRGEGYRHPPFDPLAIDGAWRVFPWLAARSHVAPHASYAIVACERPALEGFNDPNTSAVGPPRALLEPGDGLAFERVVLAAPGAGLAGAQGLAMEARARLFNETFAAAAGRTVTPSGAPLGGEAGHVSVAFYEPGATGEDDAGATPWTEAVPAPDGTFRVLLPAGRRYRAQVRRLGRAHGPPRDVVFGAGAGDASLGDVVVATPARLTVAVADARRGAALDAEVVLVPTGPTAPRDVAGALPGGDDEGCAPWLGSPYGASPSCNRALAPGGRVALDVPPGTYWVYATAGPAATLARRRVALGEGEAAHVDLTLARLEDLVPAGALAADLHVHGGRSADSAIPDRDRVLSFVTAGVDVVAATDHDVCTSYEEALAALGVGDRVVVLPGVETTGLLPFLTPPGSPYPRVIGHVNFWPLAYDPATPRNGAPWDEFLEPGQLFDAMRPRVGAHGVIQLNHPSAAPAGGVDQGYLRVVGYDPRTPLPGRADGTRVGMLYSRPGGGHRNLDYDTQEVMNGASLVQNLQYRAIWHAFLGQGVVRAGTANSDSHSLRVEPLGYPRNLVSGGGTLARFDRDAFNDAVRAGRLTGTNGPVIEAWVVGPDGARRGSGVAPFQPAPGAALEVAVRAAPWIPVEEVRVVVNGRVARAVRGAAIAVPADPFGADGLARWRGSFPLAELVGERDGWVVVEAGLALPAARDADGDGLVDRIDADGDGRADEERPAPAAEGGARHHVDVVAPGTWPMAFTNPWLVDVAGDGWTPPGP